MNEMVVSQNTAIGMPSSDILSFCAQLPERNLVAVQDGIRAVACSSPELAMACIYCAPVGKTADGRQKFAQNESVRLAEIAQSKFKHLWVRSTTTKLDDEYVSVEALAFDMQTMNTITATCTRKCYRRPPLAEAAAHSIAKRNAILGHVRPYTQTIMGDIKAAIVSFLCGQEKASVALAWKKLSDSFIKKYPDVSEKDLQEIVADEPTPVDKIVLIVGIKNALDDGNVSLLDVFAKDFSGSKFTKTKVKAKKEDAVEPPTQDAEVAPPPKTGQKLSASQRAVFDAATAAGYGEEDIDHVLMENFELKLADVKVSHLDFLVKFFHGTPAK